MTQDPNQPASDVAQLQAQVDELRRQLEQRPAPRLQSAKPGDTLNVPPPPELPDYAAEWPVEGGLKNAQGEVAPQPWDLRAQGLRVGVADDGTTTVSSPHTGEIVTLEPGAPNTVSPIVPIHGRPILGPLSSSPAVRELGVLLNELGIATSVSRGTNPNDVLDQSLIDAVNQFRQAFGVQEDPSAWPTRGEDNALVHVGAWTWEALLRAATRAREAKDKDGRAVAHPVAV